MADPVLIVGIDHSAASGDFSARAVAVLDSPGGAVRLISADVVAADGRSARPGDWPTGSAIVASFESKIPQFVAALPAGNRAARRKARAQARRSR